MLKALVLSRSKHNYLSLKKERQCKYNFNTEARSCSHCWSGKSNKYYIFWVCVFRPRYL